MMKFAKMEVINLVADVITTSCPTDCPCFSATLPGSENCPYDE